VVSTYYLTQLIGRHVKVALSGDGADELFGSYLSHRLAFPLAHYSEYLRTGDADLIRPFDAEPERLLDLAGMSDWEWRHTLGVFTDEEKTALYAPEVAAALRGCSTREHLREQFATLTATDPLNRILEAEFRTIFPDQVLTFVDRLSMAHSLEVRTAFLDTDVVTFVAGLPGRLKIRAGETKYLLKQAALKYFPPDMVFRKKEGFVMPVAGWLRGELEPYVRQTLSAERLAGPGVFEPRRVQGLLDGFYRSEPSHLIANKVLALLVFQEWYDLYMRSSV
jgi:asparagine synthase (glutamine-hydrolysing)